MPSARLAMLPAGSVTLALLLILAAPATAAITIINEIRTDNTGADTDEFFELAGAPNESLDGLSYLVIGDGAAIDGSGVIETVVDLGGLSLMADGLLSVNNTNTTPVCAGYDTGLSFSFENSDNVTHLLVSGFGGSAGDDLDIDDDGVLDSQPWATIQSCVAIIDDLGGGEHVYCAASVGPDDGSAPGHVYRCGDTWNMGGMDPCTDDTPGGINPCPGAGIQISELRIDNTGGDTDEFFELSGPAGVSLDGLTYLVLGDGALALGSGVIESVTDLSGLSLQGDGLLSAHKSGTTAACAGYDVELSLNFENGDNVTHLLVSDFTGSSGDDLDLDDDGVLDAQPWGGVVDCVALIESAGSGDLVYCAETVGPDSGNVPGLVYRCNGSWLIGVFDPVCLEDTPGEPNDCGTFTPPPTISEIRVDNPASDTDEYFELAGEPVQSLDGYSYVVIGDGAAALGSGVVESVTDLSGQSLGIDGLLAVHKLGTLATCAGYDLELPMNFENGDNVTHLLVRDFTGASGDDLDTDDDGTLDITPWSDLADCVALLDSASSGDLVYCAETVGPDTGNPPGHVFVCDGGWIIGEFAQCTSDTPGAMNACDQVPPTALSAIATTASGVDIDYDEPMDAATTSDPGSYAVFETGNPGNAVGITSVSMSGDAMTATLSLISPLDGGTCYSVEITGAEDLAGNPVDPGTTLDIANAFSGELIVITEVMRDPDEMTDTEGEWFELWNAGCSAVDLNGWTIRDNGGDLHVIDNGGPLVIEPDAYEVFARNGAAMAAVGVSVFYEYGQPMVLGNSFDELELLDGGATTVDAIAWDQGVEWPNPVGASIQWTGSGDNAVGANWIATGKEYGSGDRGTPGEPNDLRTDSPSLRSSTAALGQNQPNPFNPSTSIEYRVGSAGRVSLRVYDLAGRLVATLVDEQRPAGEYAARWNGRDSGGRAVSSGVYLYRLHVGTETLVRRMVLLK